MTLDSDMNTLSITCTKVSQNNVDFFLGSVRAGDLIDIVTVRHRAIVGFDENGLPLYNNEIQRKPSEPRVKAIKDYLLTDKFATFPNNILVSLPSILVVNIADNGPENKSINLIIDKSKINFTGDNPLYVQIFDGQHRFRGVQSAIDQCVNENDFERAEAFRNFEFVVSFFIDAPIDFQAMLFSIINRTPVKVTQDLVYDLFGLTAEDSPQKTALAVALELNGTKHMDSGDQAPFYKRIRLLAKKEEGVNSPLSQGMFVKEITKLISPTLQIAEIERFKSRETFRDGGNENTIFRLSYAEKKDFLIFKTLLNFFYAVQKTFTDKNGQSYWNPSETSDNVLQRTVGFLALLKVLIVIFPTSLKEKDLSANYFTSILSKAKSIELIDYNGQSLYEYSSVGVNKLKNDILSLMY